MPKLSSNTVQHLPVSTADASTNCNWDNFMRYFPAATADASTNCNWDNTKHLPVHTTDAATNCSEDDVTEPPSVVMMNIWGRESPDHLFEDLEPMSRVRSNSWPLRRPQLDMKAQVPALLHELILKAADSTNLYDDVELLDVSHSEIQAALSEAYREMGSPDDQSSDSYSPEASSTTSGTVPVVSSDMDTSDGSQSTVRPAAKKPTTRQNAWGNVSYADLIAQAIASSPDKRLTLFQVYEWMVQNVAYFYDKGGSNSSAGWKNSIRHNLSLHTRFMRIQNESAGKSSWWMINPEVQPGRKPRGSAQAHVTSGKPAVVILKNHILKKHKLTPRNEKSQLIAIYVGEMREEQRNQTMRSTSKPMVGSQVSAKSVVNREPLSSEDDFWLGAFDSCDTLRPRAQSDLSTLVPESSAHVYSPVDGDDPRLLAFNIFDDSPYEGNMMVPEDILGCTEEMRLTDL